MPDRPATGSAIMPFTLVRSSDVVGAREITSTRVSVHGLLRLTGEALVVQWRVARVTDRVGPQIRTDHEVEAVRQVELPLDAIAGAAVRSFWFRWPPGRYLVLTASDLRAFEEVVGQTGLRLEHPAELALPLRRRELAVAREFAGELELALADRTLRLAEQPGRLTTEPPGQALPPGGES